MANHYDKLAHQLREVAKALTTDHDRMTGRVVEEAVALRAAAKVLESQPCEHVSDMAGTPTAVIGRCQYCKTPLKKAWVEDASAIELHEKSAKVASRLAEAFKVPGRQEDDDA